MHLHLNLFSLVQGEGGQVHHHIQSTKINLHSDNMCMQEEEKEKNISILPLLIPIMQVYSTKRTRRSPIA